MIFDDQQAPAEGSDTPGGATADPNATPASGNGDKPAEGGGDKPAEGGGDTSGGA